MSKKMYLMGIDGLSFSYIKNNLVSLPNFNKLFVEGKCKILESVFPPDSIPAWITIYTGLSPADHGILDSIDYLDENKCKVPDIGIFKGKTFWDRISSLGKKVCVINPFLAFPVWDVNGFFVNGSVFSKNKTFDANNKKMLKKYPMPNLGGLNTFPEKKDLTRFIKDSIAETRSIYEYSQLIRGTDVYDLFFVTYFTMDRYQHFLWRYSDTEDSTHPGHNPFIGSILKFYQVFDEIVGKVMKKLKSDETLIIISDHGHGRRCTKTLNINEVLRKRGYFKIETSKFRWFDNKYVIERLKNAVTEYIYLHDMEDLFYRVARLFPNRQMIKKGKHLNTLNSIAEASTLFGTNPFGGVDIHRANINVSDSYDDVVNRVIKLLSAYSHKGERVFKWIKRRDEVYTGRYLEKLPDILFEMNPDYGVNWAVYTKEIGYNTTHKKISGGHNMEGCFLTYNLDEESFKSVSSISDIYNFITTYL